MIIFRTHHGNNNLIWFGFQKTVNLGGQIIKLDIIQTKTENNIPKILKGLGLEMINGILWRDMYGYKSDN